MLEVIFKITFISAKASSICIKIINNVFEYCGSEHFESEAKINGIDDCKVQDKYILYA